MQNIQDDTKKIIKQNVSIYYSNVRLLHIQTKGL